MSIISQLVTARNKEKNKEKPKVEETEMSFLEHLEELRWHILRSVVSIFFFAIFFFVKIEWVLDNVILAPFDRSFPMYQLMCRLSESLCFEKIPVEFIAISPYEQFLKSITIALLGGLFLSVPYILWEIWRFVKPGLHDKERNGLRGTVAIMSLLFFIGVAFGYYIVTPFSVQFLGTYQLSASIVNQWKIGGVISLVTQIMLGGGIVFEMPVLVYYLAKLGVITPEFMKAYRRHAVVILLVVAAVITPPDWISQVLIFFPLYLLYEVSIHICRVVTRKREKELAA